MNLLYQWFQNNLDFIYFIYGLVFVIAGIAILLQPQRGSKLRIAEVLWLFAAYALIHAPADFLDMWAVSKGRNETIYQLAQALTFVSYLFLFEFGRRLLALIKKGLYWWMLPIIAIGVVIASILSGSFWTTFNIFIGYFIRFPAGVMASAGLFLYYNSEKESLRFLKIKKYFYWASASILAWSFFCGIVRASGEFFPSNWLNSDSFWLAVNVPVQLFRTVCAALTTWAICGMLRIFNGETIAKLEKEIEEVNQNYMVQNILNELLKISLEDISLEKMLRRVIARIVSIPWLASEPKGGIFLVSEDTAQTLILTAEQGLSTVAQTNCASVPFGRCLCGRAALSGEIEFASCVDACHENTYPGMPPHGHYCVPIISGDKKILGVINLYLKEGHQGSVREKELLYAIADIIASVIERKKVEEALQIAYTELKETQSQLIHAERIEAVGIMASGVAHEVRNPLGIIIQGVDYLGGKISSAQKDESEVLEMIKDNVKRADKIIRALVDFSRLSESHMQSEDIKAILENSLFLVQHISKIENIEIVKDLKEGLPKIMADRGKLEQVFVGIFLNAIQAMPNGGKLYIHPYSVRLSNLKHGAGRGSEFFRPDEEAVVVEVEDTGVGIPKGDLQNVFEPFFTTKRDIGGSGLGLSVAGSIMDMHKGIIEIQSQEGRGTKVIITLKLARGG